MANSVVANNFWAVVPMDPQPVLTPVSATGPPGSDGSGGPGGSGGSGGDLPGRVEVRGIDHIPDAERHGRPRELFWVWFAANITYLYFVLGGVVLLLGLTLWQSVLVLVVGNLYWVGVGTLAVSGPPSGTPSVVVTRAMYGVRGNRPLSAGIGWLVAIAYEAVNLALGSLAGFALADHLGLTVSGPVKVVVLLVTAAVTFAVSIFGHAVTITLGAVAIGGLAYVPAVAAAVAVALGIGLLAVLSGALCGALIQTESGPGVPRPGDLRLDPLRPRPRPAHLPADRRRDRPLGHGPRLHRQRRALRPGRHLRPVHPNPCAAPNSPASTASAAPVRPTPVSRPRIGERPRCPAPPEPQPAPVPYQTRRR
ncbi:cytosine permease [Streptomyces sp. NPDC006365]|uniref:cytosine permease n=1 Tax=Streptomyces sp. NPDC006365 TaxID=3364744 RepID=UPI0036A8DD99